MKIGFVLYYGPEIRTYIISGLLNKLSVNNDISIISKFPINTIDFPSLKNHQLLIFPSQIKKNSFKNKVFTYLIEFHKRLHKCKMKKLGFGDFHFSNGLRISTNLLDLFLGSNLINELFSIVIKLLNSSKYYSNYSKFIEENKFDKIIYSSQFHPELIKFLFACHKKKIKLNYVLSNWKDVYMYHHFYFQPDFLFYWSRQLANTSKTINKKLKSNRMINFGNPYFNFLISDYNKLNSINIYKIYNINPGRKVILWPTAQDSMIDKEFSIIEDFNKRLKESDDIPPIILIRKNPLSAFNYDSLLRKHMNIRICHDYWKYDKVNDVLFMTENGEDEWKEILKIVDIIVTTPSTITLEASLFNIKVINFIFDASNHVIDNLYNYTNTEFYKDLVSEDYCNVCYDINDLLNEVIKFINSSTKNNYKKYPQIIDGNQNFELSRFVDKISKI